MKEDQVEQRQDLGRGDLGREDNIKIGRYIDPLSDWGFKKLFGSEPNKDLLIDLLNVIIDDKEKHIESIEYSKTEYKGLTESERSAIFDISCRTESGERFIVEMQKTEQHYFTDRLIYYSTFPVQEQAEGNKRKGNKWNYQLFPVIMIGILNFSPKHSDVEKNRDKYFYHYDIIEREISEVMSDKLRFIIVEIEKFDKKIDEIESKRDKWLYVLKNLHRLLDRPKALQARIFERIFQLAEVSNLTPEEQINYIKIMTTENDIRNQIDFAHDKGMEKGMEKEKAKTAKSLKDLGVELSIIIKSTGLSKEEIEALSKT